MRLLKIASAITLLPVIGLCQQTNPSGIDWRSLEVAWQAYIEKPSDRNADRVYNVLPASIPDSIPTSEIGSRVDELIFDNVEKLEDQVKLKKRSAVRLAFRMMTISDGAFAETLDQILGALIRVDARLFLEEFRNHRTIVRGLAGLLGNCGEEFVDNEAAVKKELKARIKSLKAVKDKNLVGVRDECITELNSQLKE